MEGDRKVGSSYKSSIRVLDETILRKGTTAMEQYTGFSAHVSLAMIGLWLEEKEIWKQIEERGCTLMNSTPSLTSPI